MPISTNPDRTAAFSLKVDAELPDAERPAFICRFLTKRQYQKHFDLMQRASAEATNNDECEKLLKEAIGLGVVGWRHIVDPQTKQPIPFSVDALDDVLTPSEIWELAWNYPQAVSVGERTSATSNSSSRTDAGKSAESANPASAVPTSNG